MNLIDFVFRLYFKRYLILEFFFQAYGTGRPNFYYSVNFDRVIPRFELKL